MNEYTHYLASFANECKRKVRVTTSRTDDFQVCRETIVTMVAMRLLSAPVFPLDNSLVMRAVGFILSCVYLSNRFSFRVPQLDKVLNIVIIRARQETGGSQRIDRTRRHQTTTVLQQSSLLIQPPFFSVRFPQEANSQRLTCRQCIYNIWQSFSHSDAKCSATIVIYFSFFSFSCRAKRVA